MAYLRIYSGDTLQEQRKLDSDRINIGRADDNDIVLKSSGVSKHHAVIEKESKSFSLIDNDSANGVFVNGKRVQRHTLKYWDEIQIFNHVFKFMAAAKLPGEEEGILDRPAGGAQQEATMEIDIASLGDLAQLRQRTNVAYLTLKHVQNGKSRYPLDKVNFAIGKARDCDVPMPGWLTPRVAAAIQRRNNGFYLIPGRRGRVSVNGTAVSEQIKLNDDDDLKVRGLAIKFYFRPVDDT